MVPFIQSDRDRTRERFRRLCEYERQNLLVDGQFICQHYHACLASSPNRDAFYEGQMSHVGEHYDLTVDGRELRIVVVGQEYGSWHRCVTREERKAMGDRSKGFKGRKPHMRGTTSLLRLLLGRPAGSDCEGELLRFPHPQPVGHIFDGYALVNFLLCSALKEVRLDDRSARGSSSPTMRQNCTKHFRATLEILEPTVIVAQGLDVRDWMGAALGLEKRVRPLPFERVPPEHTRLDGRTVDLITFAHPSAGNPYNWWGNSLDSRYLKKVVEPTIRSWRARL